MNQLALLALSSLLLASLAEAQSFVVDGSGSGDFTTIQAAVDAAPSGATILVVGGSGPAYGYGTFRVKAKALTFLGLGTSPVRAVQASVMDLSSQQEVSLRNFRFFHPRNSAPRFTVDQCDGTVRLHGCELSVLDRQVPGSQPILRVTDSDNVTLDGCLVDGQFSFRPAATIQDSRVTATRSSFVAGDAFEYSNASSFAQDALPGRDGVTVLGRSFLWLGDCAVEGGDGEIIRNVYSGVPVGEGGDGGTGLDVGPSAVCLRLDTSVEPGDPTSNFPWSGSSGFNLGAPGVDVMGAAPIIPGEQRTLDAIDPSLPSDEPLQLRVVGVPGERVTVLGSREVFFRFLGPLFGVFGLFAPDPSLTLDAGLIPASGVLEFDYDPALPPGSVTDRLDLQVLCITSPTRFRISNAESIVRIQPD